MKPSQIVISALAIALSLGGIAMLHNKPNFTTNEEATFVNWMKKTGKSYGTSNEFRFRKQVFITHLREINEINAKQSSFTFGLNKFSDMTLQEKEMKLTGAITASGEKREYINLDKNQAAPDAIDYRTKGHVTRVKDQGSCGSCWAFSVVGAFEGHYAKQNTLTEFSDGQVNQCAGSYGNYGCRGGFMDKAFKYMIAEGMTTEDKYPYVAKDGTCLYDASMKVADVPGFKWVEKDEGALKQAIGNVGVVSIGFYASSIFGYKNGIYNDYAACRGRINHGVIAVGYGTEAGQDYWIVKNSWGQGWGDSGYIRFARKDSGPGICTLTGYSTMVDPY